MPTPLLTHEGAGVYGPTGIGVKVQAGPRGPGLLVMRATPDVYPPPLSTPAGLTGMAQEMSHLTSSSSSEFGVGMATEVYPRDPDRRFLWSNPARLAADGEDHSEEMEVDSV